MPGNDHSRAEENPLTPHSSSGVVLLENLGEGREGFCPPVMLARQASALCDDAVISFEQTDGRNRGKSEGGANSRAKNQKLTVLPFKMKVGGRGRKGEEEEEKSK